jgi:hypothetical protein
MVAVYLLGKIDELPIVGRGADRADFNIHGK